MAARALAELKRVLQYYGEDANAFREALQRCPDVVTQEAPLGRFLQGTDNCVEESARKICNYWKLRKEVYGEKWYLPLTLTKGNTALTDVAIQIAELGICYPLPPNKDGDTVLYFCRERRKFSETKQNAMGATLYHRFQATFLFLHWASTQPNHKVLLAYLILERDPNPRPQVMEFWCKAARDAFPIQVTGIRHVIATNKKHEKYFRNEVIPFFLKLTEGPLSFTTRSYDLIVEDSPAKERTAVRNFYVSKYGFRPDSLPPTMGGKFSYGAFKKWYFKDASNSVSAPLQPPLDNNMTTTPLETPLNLLAMAASLHENDRKRLRTGDNSNNNK